MHRPTKIAFLAALLFTASSCQQQANSNDQAAAGDANSADPLTGTWMADLASVQIEQKPDVYLLKDGKYECSTCIPPLSLAADGAFHPVSDRPYFDSMSMAVVDDRSVKMVRRKGTDVIGETTATVSADGNTLTYDWKNSPVGKPATTGKTFETRVAAAPQGAHAMSGSWKTEKYEGISEDGLTFSFAVAGDTVTMNAKTGENYEAKLGGPEVAIANDDGGTMVKVERLAPDSIRETSSRAGKVVNVTTFTAGADGKLNVESSDPRDGSMLRYTASRK